MKIAVIGYIIGGNRITVSYDTVEKKFFIEEEYKDDISVIRFNYSVKSRKEVRKSLQRFKKDFAWNKHL